METTLREIQTRADLEELVAELYQRLPVDPVVGHYFTTVVSLDLAAHLPKIVDFWEMVLFQQGSYSRDAMAPHLRLHELSPFRHEHFEAWLRHFENVVRERFQGEAAERAIQRAKSIAMVIESKSLQMDFGKR
ncbi:MAG: group III truncated hemoglobin [Bacteroidia bacterium]